MSKIKFIVVFLSVIGVVPTLNGSQTKPTEQSKSVSGAVCAYLHMPDKCLFVRRPTRADEGNERPAQRPACQDHPFNWSGTTGMTTFYNNQLTKIHESTNDFSDITGKLDPAAQHIPTNAVIDYDPKIGRAIQFNNGFNERIMNLLAASCEVSNLQEIHLT